MSHDVRVRKSYRLCIKLQSSRFHLESAHHGHPRVDDKLGSHLNQTNVVDVGWDGIKKKNNESKIESIYNYLYACMMTESRL